MVSLEHHPQWARHVRARLRESGTPSEHVDIRTARIQPTMTPGGRLPWYKTQLPDGIDFALIDGPPCRIGRGAAGYKIIPHMNDAGEIWVDDYQHMTSHPCSVNREWVDKWCALYGWEVADAMTFDMISLGQGGARYKDKDRIAVLRKP